MSLFYFRKDLDMDTLIYSKESIEKLLNIINTLPFQGIQNASKVVEIFNILNNSIKDKPKDIQEQK
jgi:hypothetical protein